MLAAIFVAWAAWDLARRWQGGSVVLRTVPLLLSLLPLIGGALVLAWAWKRSLDRLSGQRLRTGAAMFVHLESQLARYIPGKLGVPLVRLAGAQALGVTKRVVATSIIVELISFLAVGGALGIALIAMTGSHLGSVVQKLGYWAGPLAGAVVIVAVAMLLVDRRRLPRRVLQWAGGDGGEPLAPVSLPAAHAVYWTTWAAHGYLVGRAVNAASDVSLASAGLFVLAPIAGFLAFAAPAGVGVREAVLSVGLAPAVGPEAAIAAAVLSRAGTLVADVFAWAAMRRHRPRADAGSTSGR
jgi:hypothetical protein